MTKEREMKHTPRFFLRDDNIYESSTGNPVASVHGRHGDFIVRAINARDALVAALKVAEHRIDVGGDGGTESRKRMLVQFRAALKAAEGPGASG